MKPDTICDPKEIALKSLFLGPQGENAPWVLDLMSETIGRWAQWRRGLFPEDGKGISEADQASSEFVLRRTRFEQKTLELLARFEHEFPKFSPRYLGHMFSETSLPAIFGHLVALLHNPNNISGESSRVGIQIEDESVRSLLGMVGYPEAQGAGHFTSGGTLANFEALLRARARCQAAHGEDSRPVMLVPENRHYSWKKGVQLLGLRADSLWPIELDEDGRASPANLEELLLRAEREHRPVMIVVSVAGTTELGSIDPIHELQDVLDGWRMRTGLEIWHHIDAAYGGFFRALDLEAAPLLFERSRAALRAFPRATSITLDPHKLGYVPYASGTFLCRDKDDYHFTATQDAPYIDFDKTVDRGPFTIEGSRSAAGAAAMWMVAQSVGLDSSGHGRIVERTLRMQRRLAVKLARSGLPIRIAPGCDTNVLCFTLAHEGEPLSLSKQRTLAVFDRFSPRGHGPFIVSKTALRWPSYGRALDAWTESWSAKRDSDEVVLIRMCLMNPFFDSHEMNRNFSDAFVSELQAVLGQPVAPPPPVSTLQV